MVIYSGTYLSLYTYIPMYTHTHTHTHTHKYIITLSISDIYLCTCMYVGKTIFTIHKRKNIEYHMLTYDYIYIYCTFMCTCDACNIKWYVNTYIYSVYIYKNVCVNNV